PGPTPFPYTTLFRAAAAEPPRRRAAPGEPVGRPRPGRRRPAAGRPGRAGRALGAVVGAGGEHPLPPPGPPAHVAAPGDAGRRRPTRRPHSGITAPF